MASPGWLARGSRAAMPVTPLDDMQTAAVFHQLSEAFDRFKLSADIKEPLRDYFKAKGRGVTDLPFDVDTSDESSWEDEWRAYGAAANVTDVAELLILVRWLRARAGPRGGAGRMINAASAVASLESHGVVLTPTVAAALERDMSASAAGDETTQCVNPHVAFRILTNEAPTELQSAWWWEQHSALTSLHGGVGINIPGQEEYRSTGSCINPLIRGFRG